MTDAEAIYIPEVLGLPLLGELEFYEVVADRLLESFEAELTDVFVATLPESDVLDRMWEKINQGWRVITRLETVIDFKLGPDPKHRTMSLAVINRALDQLCSANKHELGSWVLVKRFLTRDKFVSGQKVLNNYIQEVLNKDMCSWGNSVAPGAHGTL